MGEKRFFYKFGDKNGGLFKNFLFGKKIRGGNPPPNPKFFSFFGPRGGFGLSIKFFLLIKNFLRKKKKKQKIKFKRKPERFFFFFNNIYKGNFWDRRRIQLPFIFYK